MSATLVHAEGALLEQVLDGTYPIWGEGLSRRAFSQWIRAQQALAWGRTRLRRVALLDGSDLLASAKRYDLEVRLDGRQIPVLGIGAIFTPPAMRGRGHATALIDAMLAEAAAEGAVAALLFSEIGPAYYEKLGFHVLPRRDVTLEVVRGAGAPATHVRAGDERDLAMLAEIDAAMCATARFALARSPDLIWFGIVRKRLLAGLGPAGLREVDFVVAEEGSRAAAYVVAARGPQGVTLEACGDRDPSGARVGAILQVLAARAPADAAPSMRAWLPASFRPPQLRAIAEAPAAEVMMIRALGDTVLPALSEDEIVYWHLDAF